MNVTTARDNTVHLEQCVAVAGLPGCTCREIEFAATLQTVFTVAELLEVEQALEAHESDDPEFKAAIDSSSLKVALALNRPWAHKKLRENA